MARAQGRCFSMACCVVGLCLSCVAIAQVAETEDREAPSEKAERESPWVIAPKFSSDPKVGTSLGFLAGYLFKLDPKSTSSMAGAMASYSNTDSFIGTAFLRSYWNEDQKRFTAALGGGRIKNDYSDFLGSGLPASTTDEMKLAYARYLQAVRSNWFVGVQGVYTNYLAVGDDFRTDEVLKALGLTGIDSGALGLVVMYDDRNNQNAPTGGKLLNINNFAYREALGGDENFDTLNLEFKHYITHAEGKVFAYHVSGRWTHDAPNSGYSSVNLRGYTRGQYLAPHSVAIEAEERFHIRGRFGLNIFAGVACLYGDGQDCGERDSLFPSAGIGGEYMLKPSEQMVVTVDYAKGEGENSGFYVRFGQAF